MGRPQPAIELGTLNQQLAERERRIVDLSDEIDSLTFDLRRKQDEIVEFNRRIRDLERILRVYRRPQDPRPAKKRVSEDTLPYRPGAPLNCQDGQGVEFKKLDIQVQ